MYIHAYGILNDFQLKLARGGNCVLSGQFIHKINSNASKVHVKCHYIHVIILKGKEKSKQKETVYRKQ